MILLQSTYGQRYRMSKVKTALRVYWLVCSPRFRQIVGLSLYWVKRKTMQLVFALPISTLHKVVRAKVGWIIIVIMYPSGVIYLPADCCFSKLALYNNQIQHIKSTYDIAYPCLTPYFTRKLVSTSELMVHKKFVQDCLMSCTILLGIPQFLKIYHILSLCRLSNTFSKSTKLTSNFLCHSWHCSKMFLRTNMWSIQPLPFLIHVILSCPQLL